MQIGPLLIRSRRLSRERAWRDQRSSSERRGEPRRINSRIATGCASTKDAKKFWKEEREMEMEKWKIGRNRTSLDEIVLLGTINELLRGFPLDHKGNRIGLFGR